MDMLDRRVLTFLVVIEAGSFSAASKRLYVSAVSVKKQMDSLEAEIGARLLDRTNRGVSPTDAGAVLVESARRAKRISDTALHEIQALASAGKPTIKVGTSLLRPCSRLLELWSRIGTRSDFGIEIVPFDDEAELASVIAQLGFRIDCLLGPCDAPAWREACNVLELGFYDCKIAVPRGHALSGKPFLTWDDLEGQSLMLVEKGASPVLDSLRREIEERHPAIAVVDTPSFYSIETFNECARESILMETLDAWDNVHPEFVSLPMDWAYRIPYGLLYPKKPSAEIRLFAKELSEGARR